VLISHNPKKAPKIWGLIFIFNYNNLDNLLLLWHIVNKKGGIMKIVLLIGLGIYFYSRLVLLYLKEPSNSRKNIYYFFLLFIEIGIVGIIIYQLFVDPLRWQFLLSWRIAGIVLFILGIFISVMARFTLGHENWQTGRDVSCPKFLVTKGLYSWVRHPIYLGSWLMGFGFEMTLSSWLLIPVVFLGLPFIIYCSYKEEQNLLKWFGDKYLRYKTNTNWFIPFKKIKRLLK